MTSTVESVPAVASAAPCRPAIHIELLITDAALRHVIQTYVDRIAQHNSNKVKVIGLDEALPEQVIFEQIDTSTYPDQGDQDDITIESPGQPRPVLELKAASEKTASQKDVDDLIELVSSVSTSTTQSFK